MSTDKTARVINRKSEGRWEKKGGLEGEGGARRSARKNKCHKIVLGSCNDFKKKVEKMKSWCGRGEIKRGSEREQQ